MDDIKIITFEYNVARLMFHANSKTNRFRSCCKLQLVTNKIMSNCSDIETDTLCHVL